METTINLQEEIEQQKAVNYVTRVLERCDEIADSKRNDVDLFIKICNGSIYAQAVDELAYEYKCGYYDKMWMPKECNL